jgi:hypothetical protein
MEGEFKYKVARGRGFAKASTRNMKNGLIQLRPDSVILYKKKFVQGNLKFNSDKKAMKLKSVKTEKLMEIPLSHCTLVANKDKDLIELIWATKTPKEGKLEPKFRTIGLSTNDQKTDLMEFIKGVRKNTMFASTANRNVLGKTF